MTGRPPFAGQDMDLADVRPITVQAAAVAVGVSVRTVARWIADRRLPVLGRAPSGRIVVDLDDVYDAHRAREQANPARPRDTRPAEFSGSR